MDVILFHWRNDFKEVLIKKALWVFSFFLKSFCIVLIVLIVQSATITEHQIGKLDRLNNLHKFIFFCLLRRTFSTESFDAFENNLIRFQVSFLGNCGLKFWIRNFY